MNYKDAYYHLFNCITDACAEMDGELDKTQTAFLRARLMQAQVDAEDKCISSEDPPILTLVTNKQKTGER